MQKMKKMAGRTKEMKPLMGFIGQGFVGKSYADDFVRRGYRVVRYARSLKYRGNKARLTACDVVFIAVPTPTTPKGFDYSIVREVLPLVGEKKTAVIKSTVLPGTTEALQKAFPHVVLMHSPEFLRERSARFDAAHPDRNIIGIPKQTREYARRAREVLRMLPRAAYEKIMPAREAELVKYAGNCFLYFKVVYMNLLCDLSKKLGISFETVRDALVHDPRIGASHTNPFHDGGRGAGGHCFIKDFAAFSSLYGKETADALGKRVLAALRDKNNELLRKSKKDVALLGEVYGRTGRGSP